jgi:hypothetical protein
VIYQNRCDPTLRIYLLALATSRVLASFASLFDLFLDLVFSGCRLDSLTNSVLYLYLHIFWVEAVASTALRF